MAVLGVAFSLDRHIRDQALPGATLWIIGYVGLAVFAEIICLQALYRQEAASAVERALVVASVIVPSAGIGGAVIAMNLDNLRPAMPGRRAGTVLFVIFVVWLLIAVPVASAFGQDAGDEMFAWGLVVILVTLLLRGLMLFRSR